MKLCKIENCKYIHKAKGLCRKHYVMQRRDGVNGNMLVSKTKDVGSIPAPFASKRVEKQIRSKATVEFWRKIRELER